VASVRPRNRRQLNDALWNRSSIVRRARPSRRLSRVRRRLPRPPGTGFRFKRPIFTFRTRHDSANDQTPSGRRGSRERLRDVPKHVFRPPLSFASWFGGPDFRTSIALVSDLFITPPSSSSDFEYSRIPYYVSGSSDVPIYSLDCAFHLRARILPK